MNIDDTDLLAYVDGELPPHRRAEVEAAVAGSVELMAKVRALRASALPYHEAFEGQRLPAVPQQLTERIASLACRSSGRERWSRSTPYLVAAFAAGVVCCAIALRLLSLGASSSPTAQVAPWIKSVADYQALYSRDTLKYVKEDPELTARVINDLRNIDGISVQVPDLRDQGLTFKRVQRLSLRAQPVVQMVYLPMRGGPIAVCVTPDARPDETPHAQRVGDLNTVAWRRGNLSYLVLGADSPQELMLLSRQIASGQTPSLYSRNRGATTARPGMNLVPIDAA
jgi:anti-sigma factor RsiW